MNWKRILLMLVCLVLVIVFVGFTPQLQRSLGIGFGRLNDRVLVGTIAFVLGLVTAWKQWRER